jgi:hypothetical protein
MRAGACDVHKYMKSKCLGKTIHEAVAVAFIFKYLQVLHAIDERDEDIHKMSWPQYTIFTNTS